VDLALALTKNEPRLRGKVPLDPDQKVGGSLDLSDVDGPDDEGFPMKTPGSGFLKETTTIIHLGFWEV